MNTNFQRRKRVKAFSLVEVVLAMSVMSFACVTLIGLLATGLVTVHQATVATVQAQVIQAVVNDAQVHPYSSGFTTNLFFDDEGTSVNSTDTWLYTAAVTGQNLTNAGYSAFATTDVQQLKVQVVSRSSPGNTNTFSVTWPNTGY